MIKGSYFVLIFQTLEVSVAFHLHEDGYDFTLGRERERERVGASLFFSHNATFVLAYGSTSRWNLFFIIL
jgi:hypothetical protein